MMKLLIILHLFFIIYITQLYGQTDSSQVAELEIQSIFESGDITGGYAALGFGYSAINQNDAAMLHFRGGWISNRSFVFGLFATGFINSSEPNPTLGNVYEYEYNLEGAYGGIYLEKLYFPYSGFHVSTPVFFGAGGIFYACDYYEFTGRDYYWSTFTVDSDLFLLIEPSIELEFNVLSFLRIAFYTSYRLSTNVNLKGYSDITGEYVPLTKKSVFNGLSLGINMKLGKF